MIANIDAENMKKSTDVANEVLKEYLKTKIN